MKPKKMHPAGKRGAEQNNVSSPQSRAIPTTVKPSSGLSNRGLRRRYGLAMNFPLSEAVGCLARRAILCASPNMLPRAVQPSWIFIRLEWTRHGVNSENPELLIENRYRRAERASNYIPPPLQYEPETWQSTLRCRA